ncbi:MAG: DUF3429 domain-containing protein [Alphaproteobacteria bacterium PA2]|nr:MAG: DUF3429 domain-containing protein [Alphaproteobacteria bacterium PA2]
MTHPAPKGLWAMALLGLAPFPLSAIIYAYGPSGMAIHGLNVLLTWSAVTMGFVGGVRWGVESSRLHPEAIRLVGSTISPFIGWGLLALRRYVEVDWIVGGFLAAFIVQWMFDQAAPGVPNKYPRMVTFLTLGAGVSLAMALEKSMRM